MTIGKRVPLPSELTLEVQSVLSGYDGQLVMVYLLDRVKRKGCKFAYQNCVSHEFLLPGIATRLFTLVIKEAQQRFKIKRVMCWVLKENKAAK